MVENYILPNHDDYERKNISDCLTTARNLCKTVLKKCSNIDEKSSTTIPLKDLIEFTELSFEKYFSRIESEWHQYMMKYQIQAKQLCGSQENNERLRKEYEELEVKYIKLKSKTAICYELIFLSDTECTSKNNVLQLLNERKTTKGNIVEVKEAGKSEWGQYFKIGVREE